MINAPPPGVFSYPDPRRERLTAWGNPAQRRENQTGGVHYPESDDFQQPQWRIDAMARGGFRPGAGRPRGSRNRRSVEVIERASEGGELPLQFMLRIMRDARVDVRRRDAMALASAPFCHARVSPQTPT